MFKRIILKCLIGLQLHKFIRDVICRKKAIVLMYHGFTRGEKLHGIENHGGKHMDIRMFEAHLTYLTEHYSVIPMDLLVRHYTGGVGIPERAVVITMDDGYGSNHTLAYPLLKEYNVPATIFVTTDFIDHDEFLWVDRVEYAINNAQCGNFRLKIGETDIFFDCSNGDSKKKSDAGIRALLKTMPREKREVIVRELESVVGAAISAAAETPALYCPLKWGDITEMAQSGLVSIGSHTCTHSILTRENEEDITREIAASKKLIEERTGMECGYFSYPNGAAGDFDARTKKLLKGSGYSCGLTTVAGMNDANSDIFEMKRLWVENGKDLPEFIMTLAGVVPALIYAEKAIFNLHKR